MKEKTIGLTRYNVVFLDGVIRAVREKVGIELSHEELVQRMVDHASVWVDPSAANFLRSVNCLVPEIKDR